MTKINDIFKNLIYHKTLSNMQTKHTSKVFAAKENIKKYTAHIALNYIEKCTYVIDHSFVDNYTHHLASVF